MTINGFKIRHRVLCPKYKSNKIKRVVLNRVFILRFFVLNCIRVSPYTQILVEQLPLGACFSSTLVVLGSSWDRFVDNLQSFLLLPPFRLNGSQFQMFLFSNRNRPYVTLLGSRGRTDSHAGETIKHVYFFLWSTGLFAHHLWLNFFNVACQCDGLFKLTQYRISRIWHGHKN